MNLQKCLRISQQVVNVARRNMALSAVVSNQMDPIQKLFYDQAVSYRTKSEKIGGGPVDAGPGYQKMKDDAIIRLKKVYDVTDPKAFPALKFTEPDLNQDSVE